MKTMKDAVAVYRELSTNDRVAFYITLSSQMDAVNEDTAGSLMEIRHSAGIRCAHCGSPRFVKNGHRGDGTQRYLCRECGRSFLATTDSVLTGTHKSLAVWKRYLTCMMDRKTLKESAETCGISIGTAFHWRHKILDSLQGANRCVHLGGIVEADETYTPVSFKGNHSRSRTFTMPREAHKRGKDSHRKGLSSELVCIPCAVDRAGVPVAAVGKLGKVSSHCIERVFADRFHPDTLLCTDKEKAYLRFSGSAGLKLVQMETDHHRNGDLSIQRVNAYHSRLKAFLRRWNGVSTKYLPNYLTWHGLMFCSSRSRREMEEQLAGAVFAERIRIHSRDVSHRPPLPAAEG